MSDAPKPLPQLTITPIVSALRGNPSASGPAEPMVRCERCGSEMYRMHAVWRCPSCRFKTDCCGW